jgi:tetratricopeptide (TPR) repeat protein
VTEASTLRSRAAPLVFFAAAAIAIAFIRPAIAAKYHRLRVTSDVYPFGSPEHVLVESLGYRSAMADAIFAHVLVSYGLHFQEGRRFEFVGDYLDTATTLDPTFRDPYRFADTLLVLSPERPRIADYEHARKLLLRGIQNRPYDTELWLTAGQYLSYLAPPYLVDEDQKRAWRLEGAKLLARACELASDNQNVPYNCVVAAALLEKAGEREAAMESMRRLVAVSDDPEIQRLALGYLAKRSHERDKELEERRLEQFRAARSADLPFVKKDFLLVLGPRFDAARCAGADGRSREGCATSWKAWRERLERSARTE